MEKKLLKQDPKGYTFRQKKKKKESDYIKFRISLVDSGNLTNNHT